MILVTGANGGLGRLVINGLASIPGSQAIAGTRYPQLLKDAPIPVRRVDFEDPETLAEGFTGVDVLVLISAGFGEDDVVAARHVAAIDAARKAGVRHVLYTSLTGAGDHLTYALAHRRAEHHLTSSGLAWTMLRNGLYAELLIADARQAAHTGVLASPLGDGRLAAVARQDLAGLTAKLAVEADGEPGRHAGATYELAGERPIGGAELAAAVSRATGKPIAYQPGTLAQVRETLSAAGLPGFQIANIISTYSAICAGLLAGAGADLRRLLGTAPHPPLDIITAALPG